MPSPTVCAVSGTIRDTSGTVLSGATVSVSSIKPFIHPTDNSLILNYSVSTTSASDGTFTLSVVETTTPSVSLILTIKYPLGTNSNVVTTTYNVTIPNSASTTLATLISGQ
jgi:hypothetical protein